MFNKTHKNQSNAGNGEGMRTLENWKGYALTATN